MVAFWRRMELFFTDRIEPVWGHAHKGHLYFRLGFALAPLDLTRACHEFDAAYQEDRALEAQRGGTQSDIDARARTYSAYVALVLLERINDSDLSPTDRGTLVRDLFGLSFDTAIRDEVVLPQLIDAALRAIVPADAIAPCQAICEELRVVRTLNLQFAVVSLTGTLLESILLGVLLHGRQVQSIGDRDIRERELGPLLSEAEALGVFPDPSIRAACRLTHIFRNRLHPGRELREEHKLVPRVASTLTNLFDLALLRWSALLNQPSTPA